MKWRRPRQRRAQPTTGTYVDWKDSVRGYCWAQCVYCAIPEGRFGGVRNFHVEHYKPKGNSRFAGLMNKINNLLYACGICNSFKGDDWPNDPRSDHSVPAYPDPAKHDYNDLFTLSEATRTVQGLYVASRYVTERLYLNRPQLVTERRLFALHAEIEALKDVTDRLRREVELMTGDADVVTLWLQLSRVLVETLDCWSRVPYAAPYLSYEVRRPSRRKRTVA
jgi:hypothetical protein